MVIVIGTGHSGFKAMEFSSGEPSMFPSWNCTMYDSVLRLAPLRNGLGRNLVRKLLSSYFFTLINEETDDFQALADIIFSHNLRAFLTWIESVSLNDFFFFFAVDPPETVVFSQSVTIRSVQIIVGCLGWWWGEGGGGWYNLI